MTNITSLPRRRRLVLMGVTQFLLLLFLLRLLQGPAHPPERFTPTPQPSATIDLGLVLSYPNGTKTGKVEIVNRSLFQPYHFSFINRVTGNLNQPSELTLTPGQRLAVDVQPPSCAALQLRSRLDIFNIGPNGHIILQLDGFDCYPQAPVN